MPAMDVDRADDLLQKITHGELIEKDDWSILRPEILTRLDKIAHEVFPIPTLPSPIPEPKRLPSSRNESSPADADKENAPIPPSSQPTVDEGALPKPIQQLLDDIKAKIDTFTTYPPHTLQRFAELIISPRAHYKALASYLHAVDRVVQVTSGSDIYPLPPAIPDMTSMNINGDAADSDAKDPAEDVSWSNPTTAAVGSDEALGGALLTPIPWLTRPSPESNEGTPGAQIHSESTETIDGPNGMGSIETVSVSVNGVPSTGHARGVTQGELLRQEQRAGVVPVTQLSRTHMLGEEAEDEEGVPHHDEEDEEEVPHARGPEEIGVDDTGLKEPHFVGDGSVETQTIDVAAAVGRPREDNMVAEPTVETEGVSDDEKAETESTGTKREADEELEGEPPRKVRETDEGDDETTTKEAESETKSKDKPEEKEEEL